MDTSDSTFLVHTAWTLRLLALCFIFHPGPRVPAQPSYDPELATSTTLYRVLQQGEKRLSIPCPAGEQTQLWVLAGQSNMQGVGKAVPLVDDLAGWATLIPPGVAPDIPPHTRVWMFTMDHRWMPAADPLHRLVTSLLPAHRYHQGITMEQAACQWSDLLHTTPTQVRRCVGPGLEFGRILALELDQPIGLIPSAHGGMSLEKWSPDHAVTSGTTSLYGAMLERIRLVRAGGRGGALRGVLWYQGESDALPAGVLAQTKEGRELLADDYTRKFLHWVDTMRRDTGLPDLPILTVQLGRYTGNENCGPAWEVVREVQRTIVTQRPNLFVVSAIDLPLDDRIHLSGAAQQRLGRRLANVALNKVYGRSECPAGPSLIAIENLGDEPDTWRARTVIRLRFSNVHGKLVSPGRPAQFAMRNAGGVSAAPFNPHAVECDLEDPTALLLRAQGVTSGTMLIYAPGLDPYANITDEADMPIPAFGPIPIPPPPADE